LHEIRHKGEPEIRLRGHFPKKAYEAWDDNELGAGGFASGSAI